MKRLRHLLTPPGDVQGDADRINWLLSVIVLAMIAGATIYCIGVLVLTPERLGRLGLVLLIYPLAAILFWLMAYKRWRMASAVLVIAVWLIMTWAVVDSGGVYSPGVAVYNILILACGLLLGGGNGMVFAGICVLTITLMLPAHWNQLLPATVSEAGLATYWLVHSLVMAMTAVLLALSAAQTGQALARARRGEHALGERNRELQRYTQEMERRDAELGASEERYRAVSELVSDFAYALDVLPDGQLELAWITDAFAAITGYPSDILSTVDDWYRVVYPGDVDPVRGWMQGVVTGTPAALEHRIITGQGEIRWVRNHARPVTDPHSGQVVRVIGAARNVTERRMAEQRLSQERNMLRTLIDALPDFIFVKDQDSRFVINNRAHARLLGSADPQQIVGKSDFDVFPRKMAARYYADEQTVVATGTAIVNREEQTVDRDNVRHWLLTTKVPLRNDDGQVIGLVGVSRNITERKRAEEERARLLETVQRRSRQLRALNRQLAEAQETERRQLAQELHDQVGQNLTALGLNLNIVRSQIQIRPAPLDTIRQRLDDSLDLVKQTAKRIRNVLAELRPPVLDDYGLAAALEWYAGQISERSGLPITYQGAGELPVLSATVENTLFRIAQEAITNVVKHAQASRAKITLRALPGELALRVEDDGCGIAPDVLAGAVKRESWGLLTMRERADAVGAQCRIETLPDRGTAVTVRVDL